MRITDFYIFFFLMNRPPPSSPLSPPPTLSGSVVRLPPLPAAARRGVRHGQPERDLGGRGRRLRAAGLPPRRRHVLGVLHPPARRPAAGRAAGAGRVRGGGAAGAAGRGADRPRARPSG